MARLRLLTLAAPLFFACAGVPSVEHAPAGPTKSAPATLNASLTSYVESAQAEVSSIPAQRRAELDRLAQFIDEQRGKGAPVRLTFICTHNSRRSHMSQLWATVAAAHHGIDDVATFSGGTEATAFNPRAVAALQRAGFSIDADDPSAQNPHYTVEYGPHAPPIESFSKRYMDPPNPSEDFAAIMTCSKADESCPFVRGAIARIAIPYVDPKVSDGTPQEAATYDARARQIATEMLYVFSRVDA